MALHETRFPGIFTRMNLEENLWRSAELQDESTQAGLNFVKTDLDAALTFATIASQAGIDSERKIRNRKNARAGYDAVLHFCRRLDRSKLKDEDVAEVQEKLNLLKEELERLGESFEQPVIPSEAA